MSSSGAPATKPEEDVIKSWDDLLRQVEGDPNYVPELKRCFSGAVRILRREIGELDRRETLGMDSRFWSLLGNHAPWTRWSLVWLARVLERAAPCRGYEGVRARIRKRCEIREAIELLETAELFLDAGLEVEFEPEVDVEASPRRPDLVVTSHCGERLYVEVKHLHDPKAMVESTMDTSRMAWMFMDHAVVDGTRMLHSGTWFRPPNGDDEWRALAAAVRSTVSRARSAMQIAECVFDDGWSSPSFPIARRRSSAHGRHFADSRSARSPDRSSKPASRSALGTRRRRRVASSHETRLAWSSCTTSDSQWMGSTAHQSAGDRGCTPRWPDTHISSAS